MKRAFTVRTWTEGEWVIAQCAEVDVASHGHTEEEALKNLREALELYFESQKTDVDSDFDLEVKVIKPKRRRYTMDELMKNFKPEHRHGEWYIGPPVGKEIW